MKTVFIAEKPDIANAMAGFIGGLRKDLHAYCGKSSFGNTIVTWAFGHIMMNALPEAYDKEYRDFSRYPVFPDRWKKVPSPSTKKQFDYIKDVVRDADVVVNAGDPDREGQLLVDEILEYVGYNGTVKRILINAKDNESMKRAFDNITDNSRFHSLYLAGLARERADWLVGMNLSRAYTACAGRHGSRNVWRIGRVKMPTLALVVNREKEIAGFRPQKYFVLSGKYEYNGVVFSAIYDADDNAPMDCEGRIVERSFLENILSRISGKNVRVVSCEMKEKSEGAPLPYSLDTLQVEANRRYGMSPSSVLDKVQSLYEKKLVSYPRSDCNYIPASQHGDAGRILKSLSEYGFGYAGNADTGIKGRCFNDGKVSAHHAIIPTGVKPGDLDSWEKKVYDMIAVRYIIQFFRPCKYNTVDYVLEAEGFRFTGKGKAIIDYGWRGVYKADDENDEGASGMVPVLKVGDIIGSASYAIEEKTTTPPKRFTEGTLLAAMTNIWKFLGKDNPNREKLKECRGIGTPATRDTIISELMSSKGNAGGSPCIEKKGKELVPTAFGISMIENLHSSVTDPENTAVMEYNLSAISEGRMDIGDFMEQTVNMVKENISFAEKLAKF